MGCSAPFARRVWQQLALTALVLVLTRSFVHAQAQAQPSPRSDERPVGLVALGVSAGALTYTTTFGQPLFSSGSEPPHPYVNRGGFVSFEGRYAFTRLFELAARARVGWLQRGPRTHLDPNEPLSRDDRDLASLDPRLGDGHWGGSAAIILRFLMRAPVVSSPQMSASNPGVKRSTAYR